MRLRTWPILALGFGTMLLLTVLFGLDSWRRADRIYVTVRSMYQSYARTQEALREIESGIYRSGLLIRDFLLDPTQLTAEMHKQDLLAVRARMDSSLKALKDLSPGLDPKLLERLHSESDAYWESLEPVFDWTPKQKMALSWWFLRTRVLPRRQAVMEMAREIKALTAADLQTHQEQMDRTLADFRRSGQNILLAVLVLGVAVSLGSVFQILRLESRAERERIQTEQAKEELRALSQKLVHAQEEERRNLSRELHDEVGQTLTALRVELGNLERLRNGGADEEFRAHLEDAKGLTANTLTAVRSLASGLRPSVLDDFGLAPALQWQAREFSHRTGVPAEVLVEGLPADLPEACSTCLYRVVQEALTNCARHADARQVRIALHTEPTRLSLVIQDDGRGLPEQFREHHPPFGTGLGLVGMEERVRELGGVLTIHSQTGKGTVVKASIPLPVEAPA